MVWAVFILVGVVCVSLIALRHWEFRHSEEGTISGSLWQLALWFAVGAVPTYLLGVLCASFRGYDAWSWIGGILGGFLVGLGVMAFIAAPLFDMALGVSRWRAFFGTHRRGGGSLVAIAVGLLMATFPLWCPIRLGQFATPKLRHSLVHELKNPDESIRLQSATCSPTLAQPRRFPRWRRL